MSEEDKNFSIGILLGMFITGLFVLSIYCFGHVIGLIIPIVLIIIIIVWKAIPQKVKRGGKT